MPYDYREDPDHPANKVFLTDAQIQERWQCSEMKLWRMRARGDLAKPIKAGGTGKNLTDLEDVLKAERS